MKEELSYIKNEEDSNLVDFIWILVEEVSPRFNRNFGGFMVRKHKDRIGIETLWLTYPNRKALERYVLTFPHSYSKVYEEEIDEEKALRNFSEFCGYKCIEISSILKKDIGLANIYKIPVSDLREQEEPFLFKYRILPFELTRELALHFFYRRVFNNIKIEPDYIFSGAPKDIDSYTNIIEQACKFADRWYNEFVPKNADLRTKLISCIAMKEISVQTILKNVPKEYRVKFLQTITDKDRKINLQ